MFNNLKICVILLFTGLLYCSCNANKNNNYQTIKQKNETDNNYSSKSYIFLKKMIPIKLIKMS